MFVSALVQEGDDKMATASPPTPTPTLSNARTPRPNVASGGLAGLLTSLLLLLVQVQQGQQVDLQTWVATLVPLIGAVVAYFFPAYSKTIGALVGAGLGTLVVLVIGIFQGQPVDMELLTSLLSGIIVVLITAFVPNTKPA